MHPDVYKNDPVLRFASPDDWETWLKANVESQSGIWIMYAKKGSGIASITYPEALEVALCWGWIDGQVASYDAQYYLQRFTRRRPKSRWSKINCAKVEILIEGGRMQPSGLREIEAAKADGRWEQAYDSPKTISIPEDFQAALDVNPKALEFFRSLNSQNRYSMLYQIHEAKRPETRARRIGKFVDMLLAGKRLHE